DRGDPPVVLSGLHPFGDRAHPQPSPRNGEVAAAHGDDPPAGSAAPAARGRPPMNPRHDPSEERLLAYAAGTLSPPEAVVVATHLAMRPENGEWVRRLQAVGGALLDDLAPAPLAVDALDRA